MHRFKTSRSVVLVVLLACGCAFGQGPARGAGRAMGAAMRRPEPGRQQQRGSVPTMRAAPPGAQAEMQRDQQGAQRPAPIERRPPSPRTGTNPPRNGEHLAQWMNQHSNLSAAEQQRALENEPGFHELPPRTQQRIRDRLTQLNAMPVQQRQRQIQHTEWMEHLSLNQRAQVRGAMQQLGSLPPGQRQFVARSFRELRALPPQERGAMLNSGRYPMTEAQRGTLNHLLQIEPLIPPDERPER